MKKIILSFSVFLFMACTTTNGIIEKKIDTKVVPKTTKEEITIFDYQNYGIQYVTNLVHGEYDEAFNNYTYTDQMLTVVNPDFYKSTMTALGKGFFNKLGRSYVSKANGYTIVSIPVDYSENKFNFDVIFMEDHRIAGLQVKPYNEAVVKEENSNFIEKKLTLDINGMNLDGILTLPGEKGNYPCVILVHGSGPNDMDETIGPNKPFRDIANGLASRGIATFRYNKSTFSHPEKFLEKKSFTIDDEVINDLEEIFNIIKTRKEVDDKNIYILGHSLGGYVMPIISSRLDDAKGFVILAGPTRHLETLMLEQVNYIISLDGTVTDEENKVLEQIQSSIDKINIIDTLDPSDNIMNIPLEYWRYLKNYEPLEMATNIKQPVLVLQGLRDYQVTKVDFDGWYNSFNSNDNWSFKTYDNLNHLFMSGDKPSNPNEYYVPGKVSETVINDIAAWIIK